MTTKKQKSAPTRHIHRFTLTALAVIILACVANLYGAYLNQRFINGPLGAVYYFQFIVLLGGGFGAGYLLTPPATKARQHGRLLAGITYALLAVAFYMSTDLLNALARFALIEPTYPWSRWIFLGTPLVAVAATVVVAFFAQYRRGRNEIARTVQVGLICLFAAYLLFMLAVNIYDLATGTATYAPSTPLWATIGNYLVMPLTIAVIVYCCLGTIASRRERLFYTTLIALLYATLLMIWPDLRTDPSAEASMKVWYGALTVALLSTGTLTWQARRIRS